MQLNIQRRVATRLAGVAAGAAISMGAAALASPAPASAATCAPGQICFVTTGYDRQSCIVTQSNFARYYRIVAPCWFVPSSGKWVFAYTRR